MISKTELSRELNKIASGLGFDLFGITRAIPHYEAMTRTLEWIRKGYNADMEFMEKNLSKRFDPSELVPGAMSVVMVGLNYFQEYSPPEGGPRFARYSLGNDYHKIIKNKLYQIKDVISDSNPDATSRVFADSAPVKENELAVLAGLGWIGRNSMVINKKFGSWFFLGEIITTQELDYNQSVEKDHCGSCRKCIESCPTGAIMEDRTLDARRCISWLTIENKREIGDSLARSIGDRVFGCDKCQEVCPWNVKPVVTGEPEFVPLEQITDYTTDMWIETGRDEFDKNFAVSPLLRAGYDQLMRNLKIVRKNIPS